jgi:hypothetical protein
MHPKRVENPKAKRPKVKDKSLDSLIQAAWDAGWWVEVGGNNHPKCFSPEGGYVIPVPSTPSGSRTFLNKRAQFRRAGLGV